MFTYVKSIGKDSDSPLFDKLISLEELLVRLKGIYKKQTIYNYIRSKGFPHYKIRGRLLFLYEEVLLWLERSK